MINEIRLTKFSLGREEVQEIQSVYFGGGTPSLLTKNEIKKLLDTTRKYFTVAGDAEITLEANPDDINEIKLAEWKSMGVNRFSIGVQSFKQEDLVWMNRAHNAEQAYQCIRLVKEAGFTNYSVDLIYGTPTLSGDDWKKNVETIIELEVPHISCYALTVEPGTALQKMIGLKKRLEVDPDKQASQFLALMEWLGGAGYEHYEISNFARPGFRSLHNSSYWQGKTYIGIGPSAHSYTGDSRKWNLSNNTFYIQALQKNTIPYEEERLTRVQKVNEYIMTSLRTIEGIDLDFVIKHFGENASGQLLAASKKLIDTGKLLPMAKGIATSLQQDHPRPTKSSGRAGGYKLVLTKEGKLFADGIAAELFFEG